MRYRPEIDGLRAVAVFPVILFHAGFGAFSGGFVGVDVFFVISGYLITSIIINEIGQGKFSLLHFYERRARRILPALFLVMAACVPVAWVVLMPRDFQEFANSVFAMSFFSSNFLFWKESGYFDTAAELKPLLHTWSLAVEEQYYILFPLFLLGTWRFGLRWILVLLGLIFVVSLGLAQWAAYNKPDAGFFLLPTRGWELLIGVFAAFYLNRGGHARHAPLLNQGISLLGLALIAVAVFAFDEATPFPSVYALIPTLGTVFIILGAHDGTLANRILRTPIFVGIGLISYSAYLWHQPIFAFTRHLVGMEPPVLLMVTLSLAVFPLSYLSWRFVEAPFRRKQRVSTPVVWRAAAAAASVFLVIGMAGSLSGGFAARFERNPQIAAGDIGHLPFHEYVAENYYPCQPEFLAERAPRYEGFLRCMQSKPSAKIDVALVGDSHAEHLFLGVAEALPDRNVVFYIRNLRPVLSHPGYRDLLETVAADENIQHVIYSMHWSRRLEGAGDPERFAADVRATLHYLQNAGKQVTVVDSVPTFHFDPQDCRYELKVIKRSRCDVGRDAVEQYDHQYKWVLQDIGKAFNGIDVVQFYDILCSDLTCHMNRGSTLFYRDPSHLNIPGSLYVGAQVVERAALNGVKRADLEVDQG